MFGKTMNFLIDSPINAMSVSRDGLLAVAGRSLLKVYNLSEENFGQELFNLRSSNLKNLNFSNSDVTWCPLENDILATAATNGAVVVWNLQHSIKSKIGMVFNNHKRTVNKVCFQSNDPNTLLSGSQDGCMKLFDLRKKEAVQTFVSNSESVRDVQFSPHWTNSFASVQETGNVELWDIRKPDKPECNFIAHDGPVFACEWHPNQESNKWLATGGRDKTIKVWDLSNRMKPVLAYNVHTITPVSRLKWRPDKDFHIGSCSLVVDFSVYVWDIKRPYVPFAIFGTRKDVTTGFAWKNDPFTFVTSCKDGTIYQHRFETDAYYPAEHYPPIGIDFNPFGDVAFSTTDFIYRHSQTLNYNNQQQTNRNGHSTTNYEQSIMNGNQNNNGSSSNLKRSSNRLPSYSSAATNATTTTTFNTNLNNPINSNSNNSQPLLTNQTSSSTSSLLSSSLTNNIDMPTTITTNNYHQSSSHYHNNHYNHHHHFNTNNSSTSAGNNNNNTNKNNRSFLVGSPSNQNQQFGGPGGSKYFQQQQLSSSGTSNYNISVPISYRKTNENILAEHFRCMISYMMLFSSKQFPGISKTMLQEISMKHFIISAKKYLLLDRQERQDRQFEENCEFNAQIAESLGRYQIAQTWRMIRHLFSIMGRHPTSSGGGAAVSAAAAAAASVVIGGTNNPSGGSLQQQQQQQQQNMTPLNDPTKNDGGPSRHTSGGTRNFSGNNTGTTSASTVATTNTLMNHNHHHHHAHHQHSHHHHHHHNQLFTKDSKDSNDPDDSDNNNNFQLLDGVNQHPNHHHNHFPTLIKQDTMPSNKFVVDFFDLQPNSLLLEQEIIEQRQTNLPRLDDNNSNLYEYELNCQEWELQRESIFHRHNISEYSIQMNDMNSGTTQNPMGVGVGGDNSLMGNYEQNSSISFDDEDDFMDFNLTESPGFSNANLQALLASKNPAPPLWSFIELVAEMLKFYADNGDVQTTCSIIMVLGENRMKQITTIDKKTINIWFRSYIDLLHRFRLWNISTKIIQLSSDSEIQNINQTLTSVLIYCANCFKPMKTQSAICDKCRNKPTSCSICQVSVRGLFVWCQGCAHGGHLQHILEWFKYNQLCPAGCGHNCEYC